MEKKYWILCVAGQSNAVGFDESAIPADYLDRFDCGRIFQLGLYGEDNLKVIPLGACAQSYQDMRPYGHPGNPGMGTRGIHLPLAHRLLPYIPEDCGILVISCAYGGTGFTVGQLGPYDEKTLSPAPGGWQWGVESNYYRGMVDRIGYALDLNPENRFLGTVWGQGRLWPTGTVITSVPKFGPITGSGTRLPMLRSPAPPTPMRWGERGSPPRTMPPTSATTPLTGWWRLLWRRKWRSG